MSKKLISVLAVLALAFSLVFVVGLPATKAEAATANYKQNLEDADPDTTGWQADCPACGTKNVTWTELPKTELTKAANVSGSSYHFYLTGKYEPTYSGMYMLNTGSNNTGIKVCIHLNGQEATFGNGLRVTNDNILNVIAGAGGSVTYTGTSSAPYLFTAYKGTLNLYGGTYNLKNTDKPLIQGNGTVNIYDAKINGTIYGGESIYRLTTLCGSTTVKLADFSVDYRNSLVLADGWNGSITEYKPYATSVNTYTGLLTSDRIKVEGTYSGTINGGLVWNGSAFVGKAYIIEGDAFVPYPSAQAAVAAYTDADYQAKNVIRLYENATVELTADESYYIDANGKNVNVTGTGTLYPMDSANDKYDEAKCGKWTIPSGVTVVNDVTNGNRYITIKTGNVYTTHRLEMKLTHVTLKTSNAGLYFKAEYKCDDTLAERVTRYGVTVKKNEIPDAVGGTGVGYSELTTGFAPDAISHSLNTNSGAVVGIFKYGDDINNKERAETSIGARVYFTVNIDGTNTLNCLSAEGGSYSLYNILNAIDSNWGKYNEAQRTTVYSFYNAWKGIGASNCRIENLGFTKLPDADDLEYELKVGYAYFDMTPQESITSLVLGGRGSTVYATGEVKNPLPGTCVAFKEDGENGQTVLMYTLDIIGAYSKIMSFVADISTETGIPESNILINTTHSHSAPSPSASAYTTDEAKAAYNTYMEYLKKQMIAAGKAAITDLTPAQMYTASVKVPNMNAVRHYLMNDDSYAGDNFGDHDAGYKEHTEVVDDEMQLIKFVRTNEKKDVLLMNWQGHPNRSINGESTTDILSGLELMRAELAKPEHDTLLAFFLGASGNVNNSSRISGEIPKQDNYNDHYAALLEKIVTVLKDSNSFTEVPVGKLQVLGKTVSLVSRDDASLKNMSIYGFSVGDVAFVMAPYEMFNTSGLFIKENSPYVMTFVSTCSMGSYSYIPTKEVFAFTINKDGVDASTRFEPAVLPHVVYEANACQFAIGTAEELADEFVTLLREMKAG